MLTNLADVSALNVLSPQSYIPHVSTVANAKATYLRRLSITYSSSIFFIITLVGTEAFFLIAGTGGFTVS